MSIQVVDDVEGRFVVTTFSDGAVERRPVDPTQKPRRRPRKPVTRLKAMDRTRQKRF